MSDILDAASDALGGTEAISTEDMLGRLDKLNERLKHRQVPKNGYFVGSLDA